MESYINSLLGQSTDDEMSDDDAGASSATDIDASSTGSSTDENGSEAVVINEEFGRPLLPFPFAKRFEGFVLEQSGRKVLYHTPTIGAAAVAEIQRFLQSSFECKMVPEGEFEQALAQAYESRNNEAMQMVEDLGDEMDLASLADSVPESDDLLEQEDDAPIIRLINALLTEAVKENASDIHIETFEKCLVVRYRLDGVLREVVKPKRALAPFASFPYKGDGEIGYCRKRIPQDGRISIRIGGREIDSGVNHASSNGERVVMRLLDKQAGRPELSSLGMPNIELERFKEILHRPHGIVLVTGPTGSGKTTPLRRY